MPKNNVDLKVLELEKQDGKNQRFIQLGDSSTITVRYI